MVTSSSDYDGSLGLNKQAMVEFQPYELEFIKYLIREVMESDEKVCRNFLVIKIKENIHFSQKIY